MKSNDRDVENRLEAIFNVAVGLSSPEEREAYLNEMCGEANDLRRRVEALLQTYPDSRPDAMFDPSSSPAEAPSSTTVLEGVGDRIGNYLLKDRLGAGGFGEVYLAEQQHPVRRDVAVKILKAGMDTREVISRFEGERQALALMDHAGIAKVYDAGITPRGRPFFVMELAHGQPITRHCDERKASVEERLERFVEICRAVQHAHHKGIIHRDLKPSNILVGEQDGRPVVKVIDFGIAKATGDTVFGGSLVTQANRFMGTPAYMSPEQARGAGPNVDTRTDLYSLGVLLFELLTGSTPLQAERGAEEDFETLRHAILEQEPCKPSSRVATLSRGEQVAVSVLRQTEAGKLIAHLRGDLDWIVLKALEKDRDRRYESAAALAQDVERHLRHEPVSAVAPSTLYRVSKFARRHRTAVAASVAVLLSLIAGTAVSTWQALRATERAAEARRQEQRAERAGARATEAEQTTRTVFSQADLQAAEQLLERGRDATAVAHLSRALRSDPDNRVAAARLLTTLAEGRFLPAPRVITWPGEEIIPPLLGQDPQPLLHAVSPDGSVVVLARRQEIHVFDASTGEAMQIAFPEIPAALTAIALAPDGETLVVGMANGAADVLDLADGRRRQRMRLDEGVEIAAIHPSPEGETVVLIGNPPDRIRGAYTASVWNLRTGERLAEDLVSEQPVLPLVRFAGDGSWLAIAATLDTSNHGLILWDVRKRAERARLPTGPRRVLSYNIAPGDDTLAMVLTDHTIRVIDTSSLEVEGEIQPEAMANWVAFHPSGTALVAGFDDLTIRMFRRPHLERSLEPLEHSVASEVLSTEMFRDLYLSEGALSPDGLKLATVVGGRLHLWDLEAGELLAEPVLVHYRQRSKIRFTPDGRRLLIYSDDGVQIFDLGVPAMLPTWVHAGTGTGVQVITPDGTRVATAFPDRTVRVWDPQTRREVLPPLSHEGNVSLMAVSDDGSVLATVADTAVSVWDLADGSRRTLISQDAIIRAIKLSQSGDRLAVTTMEMSHGKGGAVTRWEVWDVATSRRLLSEIVPNAVQAALMSRDGRRTAMASTDGFIWRELSSESGEARRPAELQDALPASMSADGARLAAVHEEPPRLQVWETESMTALGPPLVLDRGYRESRLTPDGSRLVVLDGDGLVSVIEVGTGRTLHRSIHLREGAALVDISPDNRSLLTQARSPGGTSATVWDLDTGSALTGRLKGDFARFIEGGRRVVSDAPPMQIHDLPPLDAAIPSWLPEFAEARVARRFQESGHLETVLGDPWRVLAEREISLDSVPDDPLLRWLHWTLSGGGPARTPSPWSGQTLDAHVDAVQPVRHVRARDLWGGVLLGSIVYKRPSLDAIRAVLTRAPFHPLAMAELGAQRAVSGVEEHLTEGLWWTREAANRAPENPDVWLRRTRALMAADRWAEALRAAETGLEAAPEHIELGLTHARILDHLGRPAQAIEALDRVVTRASEGDALARTSWLREAHRERARLHRALERPAAAQADFLAARGISPAEDLPATAVDLSAHYNAGLDESILPLLTGRPFSTQEYTRVEGHDFSPLPRGVQTLGGVPFDIRGALYLFSTVLEREDPGQWPLAVEGIPVARPAGRLHFLLGVGTADRMIEEADAMAPFAFMSGNAPRVLPLGTEAARLRFHYEDGSSRELPLRLGFELHDFRLREPDAASFPPPDAPVQEGWTPVWTGVNAAQCRLILGRFTWGNPQPHKVIRSLDFISSVTEASPFLIALTAEPLEAYEPDLTDYAEKLIGINVWYTIGLAWASVPEVTEARLASALQAEPERPGAWLRMGILQMHQNSPEEAAYSFTKALEYAARDPVKYARHRGRAARFRALAQREADQSERVAADLAEALGIPPRPASLSRRHVDLSAHYNGALTDNWTALGPRNGNDLSPLEPFGAKELGGVTFDVRGVVQLANWMMAEAQEFPLSAEGIPLGFSCRRLHFLHAALFGGAPPGTPAGHYQIHYADGESETIGIELGKDLLDWWTIPGRPEPTGDAEVVWTGWNDAAAAQGAMIRLFKISWENPRPDVAIRSVDFVSARGPAAPFLVGITGE